MLFLQYIHRRIAGFVPIYSLIMIALIQPASVLAAMDGTSEDVAAWALFSKVAQANKLLSYSGSFVYSKDGNLETMSIDHGIKNGTPIQRLAGFGKSPREIIKDEESVSCVLPDKKMGIREGRRDMTSGKENSVVAITGDIDQIKQNYKISLLSDSSIAGRPCQNLKILSKDELRYSYVLCVDKSQFLPLKSVMMNSSGKVVESQMFTQITFHEFPPNIDSMVAPASLTWLNESEVAVSNSDTLASSQSDDSHQFTMAKGDEEHFSKPIAGFEVIHTLRRNSPALGKDILHFVLSDGLANVSVFILPIDESSPKKDTGQEMGAINAYSRVVGQYKYIALGEVPYTTVQLLVNSLASS